MRNISVTVARLISFDDVKTMEFSGRIDTSMTHCNRTNWWEKCVSKPQQRKYCCISDFKPETDHRSVAKASSERRNNVDTRKLRSEGFEDIVATQRIPSSSHNRLAISFRGCLGRAKRSALSSRRPSSPTVSKDQLDGIQREHRKRRQMHILWLRRCDIERKCATCVD